MKISVKSINEVSSSSKSELIMFNRGQKSVPNSSFQSIPDKPKKSDTKLSSIVVKLPIPELNCEFPSGDLPGQRSANTTKTKSKAQGLTIKLPSNENFNYSQSDDYQLPEEIFQLSIEKFGKFNFTPKVNPRLKVIREQESKFTSKSS